MLGNEEYKHPGITQTGQISGPWNSKVSVNSKQTFSHVEAALWKQSIAHWTKKNRLVPHATDVLYCLGTDITSLWSWGPASSDSRNTARDWLKWALYHLWSVMLGISSYICKSNNKYASRDNRFSWIEKRNRSRPGGWILPISKDSRMSGSLSPVRKDHLQRKAGTGRCSFRNKFMIQTQIHSNIYSIKFDIGILAEIQSLH